MGTHAAYKHCSFFPDMEISKLWHKFPHTQTHTRHAVLTFAESNLIHEVYSSLLKKKKVSLLRKLNNSGVILGLFACIKLN